MHAELIDVVSAFSRIAGVWDEKGTVDGFIKRLPAPDEDCPPLRGPKANDARVTRGLAKGKPCRAVWLEDAYRLRSQFGHGHVQQSPYKSIWTEREHLLLAAVAFPLYVKAVLAQKGLYTISEEDRSINAAFDALALLTPFAEQDEQVGDISAQDDSWGKTIARAQMNQFVEKWERELLVPNSEENAG